MRNRKAAWYGALASLPWVISAGITYGFLRLAQYQAKSTLHFLLAVFLATFIVGVPAGALGAVLFLKVRGKIPGQSTVVRAVKLAVLVWVVMEFPSVVFSQLNLPLALGSLIGVLSWAYVLAPFIDKDLNRQHQGRKGEAKIIARYYL